MKHRVSICRTPPQTMLCLPRAIRADRVGTDIAEGMRELVTTAQRAELTTIGASTITFREPPAADGSTVVDFGVVVEPAPKLGPASGATLLLEPDRMVARICYRGGYRELEAVHRSLRAWLRDNGYRAAGPAREAYLVGPDEVSDPRELLTEITIPVVPAPSIALLLDEPFATALDWTRKVLREYDFEVVGDLDVRALLHARLGEPVEDYTILSACHPGLAQRALAADREAGLLLPCTVVVRAVEGGTQVEVADPEVLAAALPLADLLPVAAETRRLLIAALTAARETDQVTTSAVTPR
ncbi:MULTISPECIES: DUF302 domain-containing protein [unclassified Nocardia]|uniref:DUF302 domain-containing protein n=1 Tax=unclassified Nocardia TaxID=2637762 RepID=UPI00278C758B|nr:MULTISPECIES: DUF302 domain-containing protein [unclassified Nocardia]